MQQPTEHKLQSTTFQSKSTLSGTPTATVLAPNPRTNLNQTRRGSLTMVAWIDGWPEPSSPGVEIEITSTPPLPTPPPKLQKDDRRVVLIYILGRSSLGFSPTFTQRKFFCPRSSFAATGPQFLHYDRPVIWWLGQPTGWKSLGCLGWIYSPFSLYNLHRLVSDISSLFNIRLSKILG